MKDTEFRALLTLFMASDPTPLSEEEDKEVGNMLDRESNKRGYDSWVVAYHEFKLGD